MTRSHAPSTSSRRWCTHAPSTRRRYRRTAGLLTGGSPGALAAEIFDPATGRFAETAPMRTGRALHAATLLDDGRVLIVGNGGQQPPTELFIPATSP